MKRLKSQLDFFTNKLHRKIPNRTYRLRLIGDWFESLYHDLLPGTRRGTKLRNNYQNGDLTLGDLLFEVKGSSNGQKPVIPVDQFEELMGNVPSPYNHLVYLVSFYRVLVWRDGRTQSILTEETPTPTKLDEFLARRTKDAFAIHHRLFQHLLKNGNCERVFDRGPSIRFTLGYLRRAARDELLLRRLRLASETFAIHGLLRGCKVGPFTMTVIAPPRVIVRIKRLLSRSIWEERRSTRKTA